MSDESETYPPCRCGREVRKLNAASDTPKCTGCGYTEELCRCAKRVTVIDEVGPVTEVTLNDDGTIRLHFEVLASHEQETEIEDDDA